MIRDLIYDELQNRICEGDTVYYNSPNEKEFRGKFIVRKSADNFHYIQKHITSKYGSKEFDKVIGGKIHEPICEVITMLDPKASITRMVLTEKIIK